MNYIVLDMEWNQPVSYKKMVKEPVMLYGEIIQIGAVKLDENFQVVDIFKMGVFPKHYSKMHKKVKALTRITNGVLRNGLPFPMALSYFRIWCGEDVVFLTWGSDDMDILRDNMLLHQMSVACLPMAYNLQYIFDAQVTKIGQMMSLKKAVAMCEVVPRQAHDALNDALNTAEVCKHLDINQGIAAYDNIMAQFGLRGGQPHEAEVERVIYPNSYKDKKCALAAEEVRSFFSEYYGCEVLCEPPVKQNDCKYVTQGHVASGETCFVRLKFKKMPDGSIKMARILYEWNEAHAIYYAQLQEKAEQKYRNYLEHIQAGSARMAVCGAESTEAV